MSPQEFEFTQHCQNTAAFKSELAASSQKNILPGRGSWAKILERVAELICQLLHSYG